MYTSDLHELHIVLLTFKGQKVGFPACYAAQPFPTRVDITTLLLLKGNPSIYTGVDAHIPHSIIHGPTLPQQCQIDGVVVELREPVESWPRDRACWPGPADLALDLRLLVRRPPV